MKIFARRLRRLEHEMGFVGPTPAEREANERVLAGMVRGLRRYAASLGRDLTAEGQQRIAELERPAEGRTTRVPLTIETIAEALERGHLSAALGDSE